MSGTSLCLTDTISTPLGRLSFDASIPQPEGAECQSTVRNTICDFHVRGDHAVTYPEHCRTLPELGLSTARCHFAAVISPDRQTSWTVLSIETDILDSSMEGVTSEFTWPWECSDAQGIMFQENMHVTPAVIYFVYGMFQRPAFLPQSLDGTEVRHVC